MPKNKMRRITEVGWDTDLDDDSLFDLIAQRRAIKKQKLVIYDNPPVCRQIPQICNFCSSLNTNSNTIEAAKEIFKNKGMTHDATPEKMFERKWALAQGKFRIITRPDAEELEELPEFKEAVLRGRPHRQIRYVMVPRGYSEEELLLSSKPCVVARKTRYSYIKAKFPGSGDRHHIIWTTRSGDIMMDRGVKLYDINSLQCHQVEVDCRGPKSPWFALVDPTVTATIDGYIHFDANLFWTTGLLYKHFNTCGIESWDAQLDEMRDNARTIFFSKPPPPLTESMRASQTLPSYPVHYNYPQIQLYPATRPSAVETVPYPQLTSTPILPTAPPPTLPVQTIPTVHSDFNNLATMHTASTNLTTIHPDYTTLATIPAIPYQTITPVTPMAPPVINQRYTGSIDEWKGSFGFISCDFIPGLVFLHCSDILNWDDQLVMPPGTSVNFSLRHDRAKGYKAFNAKLFL